MAASRGTASDWEEVQIEAPSWKVSKICMIMVWQVEEFEFWLHHEGDLVSAQVACREYLERQVPHTPMFEPEIFLKSKKQT